MDAVNNGWVPDEGDDFHIFLTFGTIQRIHFVNSFHQGVHAHGRSLVGFRRRIDKYQFC